MAKVDLATLASADVPDSSPRAARPAGATELPIHMVAVNPLNQRTSGDEDAAELEALAATIREHGVLQPLMVATASAFLTRYPDQHEALADARWVALIGNRRLQAAQLAERRTVPALINDEHADSLFEVMLVENSHRRDLAPLREAEAMRRVLDHNGGVSRRELARRIGRSHTYINQRLALLTLIPALRDALESGSLMVERARDLGEMTEDEQQAVADAGPPWRSGNGVSTPRAPRRVTLPRDDPAAAARSIREAYTGDELAELIRLLST